MAAHPTTDNDDDEGSIVFGVVHDDDGGPAAMLDRLDQLLIVPKECEISSSEDVDDSRFVDASESES